MLHTQPSQGAHLTETLLSYAQHKIHPLTRSWFSPNVIEENLRREIEGDLERLVSDDLAEGFKYHCPIPNTLASDYKNRLLDVDGLSLLAGIRFLGGDLGRPFVGVLYQSTPLLEGAQLTALLRTLKDEFAVFNPKQAHFYRASHLPSFLGVQGDKRFLAAPLRELKRRPLPDAFARISLQKAATLDFYPAYSAVYEQLHAEQPELKAVTRRESEEDLAAYHEEGTLFEVFVDGAWAGVIAVFRSVDIGLHGYCMGEIVLHKAYRGQMLGAAVQRHLIERLDDRGEVLYGTIGANNTAALRTAQRVGRIDLGGHFWIPL